MDLKRFDILLEKIFSSFAFTFGIFSSSMLFFGLKIYDIALTLLCLSVLTLIINFIKFFKKYERRKISEHLNKFELKIDRFEIAEQLAEKIMKNEQNFHIIVGSSGAGKSILINEYIPKFYNTFIQNKDNQNKGFHQIMIKDYINVDNSLLKEINRNGKISFSKVNDALEYLSERYSLIIVFDQFESLFMLDKEDAQNQFTYLCNLFNKCQKESKAKCIIVIRKEWYFNLKFFEDYIPHIKKVHVIDGVKKETESKAWEAFKNEGGKEIGDSALAGQIIEDCQIINKPQNYYVTSCKELKDALSAPEKNICHFLPVEFTTILESIFIRRSVEGTVKIQDYKISGGRKAAIENYFKEYYLKDINLIEEDAIKILYALSVSPSSTRSLTEDQIIDITNLEKERVRNVLDHFIKQKKFIKTTMRDKKCYYDWKHDFYAETFNKLSGTLLDPTDRDNINFFWYHKENPIPVKDEKNLFGLTLFFISFIALLARTFKPVLDRIFFPILNLESFSPQLFTLGIFKTPAIDISFIPIVVTLTLWSWYVTSLYRRILSRIEENKINSIYSIFIALWSVLLVLGTIFIPKAWIVLTGLGGLVVALKYKNITKNLKSSFIIRGLWRETFWNSLLTATFIGGLYIRIIPPNSILKNPTDITLGIVTLFFMIGYSYFAILCVRTHIGKNIYTKILGLAYRSFHIRRN